MEIKCPKCKHEWNYKGKSKHYLTCPECYKKINIRKLKENEMEKLS